MSYPVRGELLGMQLHDHRSLRLAVLNACEGARSSRQDPFSGVAQSLLQQRVPAVIAMQFEISDAAAKVFAAEFYRAVAEGSPVDAAVCESRKALFKEEFGQEWATPVLYMRSQEGQLFELQAVAAAPPADETLKKRQAEEAERLAAAKAETARQAGEKAEAERQAAEKAEAERAAAAKAEAERLAAQKAEAERVAKAEKERLANEKAEQDQLALAKAEAARQAAAKAEAERAANAERERLASEAAEKARLAHQQEEAERRAKEQTEFENLQRKKKEAEQQRHEKEAAAGVPEHLKNNLRPRPDRRVWLALLAIPVLGIATWGVRTYETRRAGLGDSEGHYQEGETLRAEKNFDGAIVAYREAIRARPEFPAAHLGLGIALRDKGDLNNAASEIREVLRERPSDAGAHNALGLTLFRAGDFNGAAVEYQEFVRLNPQDAEAHYNLANALEKKGDREGAVAEYRETLRLKPDFADSHSMPEFSVVEKPSSGGSLPDNSVGPRAVVQPTPKTPASNKPVPQGGQVQAARLVKRVDPVYPPTAAQAHVTGMVRLHAIINKTGEVREVDVISGHPLLLQSAMSAVKQWRYRPTLLNGRPVEVETTIVVEFSLTGLASNAATDVKAAIAPAGKMGPVTPPPVAQSVCSFGNIEFSEQGNRLIGTVPYTYQGSYPLDSVALLGVPWTKAKQQIPGLSYGESTLKTASGKASFSIEGRPTLNQKEEESVYLVISIVTKGDNKVVCGKVVPYQKKW
jgi:TonB family protein